MIYDYHFTSHYLELEPGRLHYLDEGEGPVVILLHGNPTWSYYYRSLARLLAKNFRVIVPDHMGCGLSDKPQKYEYTLANHIENITKLLEHLKISRTSLVAHDWGGAIGMGVATGSSRVIEKIVVLNSAAFRSTRIPFRIRICRWPIIGKCIVKGLNGFAYPATFMAVEKKLDKRTAQAYLLPYDSWQNRIAIYEFVKDIPLEEHHRSYRTLVSIEEKLETLKTESTPMLIVWGGKDFCFNDHFFKEWLRRFPNCQSHYLENGGHYLLEDEKEIVEPLIEGFLKS